MLCVFFLRGGDAENVTARYSEGKPLGFSRDCRLEKWRDALG